MKKNLFSILIPIFIVIGFSSNSFGSSPSASFMNLPVSFFYGDEVVANTKNFYVTVSDFEKYAFKPGEQSWEALENNQYIFSIATVDAFKGTTTTIKILFKPIGAQSSRRALMSRCILNGTEITAREGLGLLLHQLTEAANQAERNR